MAHDPSNVMPVVGSAPKAIRRAYLDVAQRLCAMLAEDGLKSRDRIPAEPDLMKRLGVGRPLLREAIVALQAGGQIAAKPGTGLFLLEDPRGDWLPAESTADLGPSIIEQLETRLLVECELVELAAGLITPADLARLEALVAEMQANDPVDDPRLGIEFHVTIARASGRKVLAALVEAIFDLRQGPMWKTLRQQMLRPEHYRRTIADRVAILQALKAGDGVAAREAMRTMVEVVRYRFFEEQGAASDNEPAVEGV